MLKRMSIKKILVTTSVLFAMFLLYIIPSYNHNLLVSKQELNYVEAKVVTNEIFLLDNNNYVARTKVPLDSIDTKDKIIELLEVLIIDGKGESKIPSGFKAIIPNDTIIKDVNIVNGLLKLNFSSSLLKVKSEYEEKVIETIVYTLTTLSEVEKIMIHVDGEILTTLPSSGRNLPSVLDRGIGVNKKYDFTNVNNIIDVTVYYIKEYNGQNYYVPVTKYINDKREKINIVVDELASNSLYTTNLMSFLDSNAKLLSVVEQEQVLRLEFNDAIFNNLLDKDILEEVRYTILLSALDNYNINDVVLAVNGKEIKKSIE